MRTLSGTPTLVALSCLVPVSAWWFLQIMNPSGDLAAIGSTTSLQAVAAVFVLQLLSAALFGPQIIPPAAQDRSFPGDVFSVAALVLPALPLLAMLGLASGLSVVVLLRAECLVFATGFGTVLAAQMIGRSGLTPKTARVVQTLLGIVAASSVWIFRQNLLQWIAL